MSWSGEAAVDAARGAVRCGDALYPFRLSPRRGGVVLGLPEGEHCVRPLSWGEQSWLAGFTALGEDALGDALIEMVSDAPDPAALSPASRAALVALWGWIDGQVAAARPLAARFDSAALARAALAVHRATGWPSGTLDTLPAGAVLAYAAALAGDPAPAAFATEAVDEPEAAAPPPPGVTRIEVVPDPARTPLSAAEADAPPARAAAQDAPTARATESATEGAPESPETRPAPVAVVAPETATGPVRPRFRLMASRAQAEARARPQAPSIPSAETPTAQAPVSPARQAPQPAPHRAEMAAPDTGSATTERDPVAASTEQQEVTVPEVARTPAAPLALVTARPPNASEAAPGPAAAMRASPHRAPARIASAAAPAHALAALAKSRGAVATEVAASPVASPAQAEAAFAWPDPVAEAASVAAPAPSPLDDAAMLERLSDAVADRIEARLREAGRDLGLDMED